MIRPYLMLNALRGGETVDLGGLKFKMDVDEHGNMRPIAPGDLYIAERNTGPQLLTAAQIVGPGEVNGFGNWIQPTTNDYSYDIWECIKVIEAQQ